MHGFPGTETHIQEALQPERYWLTSDPKWPSGCHGITVAPGT